ncbi:TetR/AcrR family transcriptional regulator [Lichenihabitans sp. PAMC28606]|uniref:helix-turn-helix domain-containing protein n=1 Tax=Lichenihabitans sp. PAMC28606 TaxID=2880932 RepID=UPI001D0A5F22|nr:helix-turn-helix domain-containing protein [Lichenihabitans sp. PAMC28606]UDL93396.1 TetR/AcrR family transcriptional regulator [Lichenihabitans sp. PAMC28606]
MIDRFQHTPRSTPETGERDRILVAAREIFSGGGIDVLKRRTIADMAGVTPNTVSRNFRSRATLIDRLAHAE